MKSYSRPMIRADGNSTDFPAVEYDNKVDPTSGGEARVTNHLSGSDAVVLQGLIDNGQAEWVIEIRSPAVLYSRSHRTRESVATVSWDINETGGPLPVFIISGLVAVKRLTLPSSILNEVWQYTDTLEFAEGNYLARGTIFSAEPLLSSMLEFKCDDKTRPGEMRIEGPNEHIKFTVHLAKDIHTEIRQRRDVWISALIGALAKFDKEEHDPEESRVLREISMRLTEKGVSDWCSDDFDPAAAATCLEPLQPIGKGEAE